MKINRIHLNSEEEFVKLILTGDWHIGDPNCLEDEIKKMFALNIPMVLMGDLLECSTKTSIADGVYRQKMTPQEQIDYLVELLTPSKHLIMGIHEGNHEARSSKSTSIDILKNVCRELNIPYLGQAGWSLIYTGGKSYTLYSFHGKSGATTKGGKINVVHKRAKFTDADVIAMGHVHDLMIDYTVVKELNKTKRRLVDRKKHVCITGSFLDYNGSYAEDVGYEPSLPGYITLYLYKNENKVKPEITTTGV